MEDLQPYLQPTRAIESDHPRIRALAADITAGTRDVHENARRLFLQVRDQIRYSIYNPFFLPEHYRAIGILERGRGYCVQKAVVLCALARAAGIPARLVFADIVNHLVPERFVRMMGSNLFVYHCYDELHLDGRWIQITPSFDRTTCEENGFPLVEFDGHNEAIFPPVDSRGRPFVEYVRHHGTFADVPLAAILQAWEQAYGRERVELWKRTFLYATATAGQNT